MRLFILILLKLIFSIVTAIISTFGLLLITMIICETVGSSYYFQSMSDIDAFTHPYTIGITTIMFMIVYEVIAEECLKPIISKP